MFTIIALSLLGIGASAFIIDEIVNDDDDEPARDVSAPGGDDDAQDPSTDGEDTGGDPGDVPPEDETGTPGFETVFMGTEGDDTIEAEDIDGNVETVEAGGGDDSIATRVNHIEILGQDGNDTITIGDDQPIVYNVKADGGAGDDVITARNPSASVLRGGDGNDVINVQQESYDEEFTQLEGGDGDDILNLDLAVPDESPQIGLRAYGGDGADTYTLTFTPAYGDGADEDADPARILDLRDFDPAEDQIVIDLSGTAGSGDAVETEIRESEDDGSLEVVVSFLNEAGDSVSGTINLGALTGAPGIDPQAFISVVTA
ncbi:MAG: hypothetical protein ACE369_14550 [Roseovarius sp.]